MLDLETSASILVTCYYISSRKIKFFRILNQIFGKNEIRN
jgi:hypothetical protein